MTCKVVHFSGEYYKIKYRFHWWMPYRSIQDMGGLSSDPRLNAMEHFLCIPGPMILLFDEAKALAESFTESSLRKYLLQQEIDFKQKQVVIRQEWNKNKHKQFKRDTCE